ncbi:hypothetical protein IE53DRAFT_386230 [Violaceomyces palustris]|uniref:Uncharacterized protein n=1 Tax=Violaceomyces palustris TaxID=1673888 RepID=A0ACD0NZZ4_9BASI|nr:hypothetical protein IE53DRAFT_386230 [Violaceomyces palustris]
MAEANRSLMDSDSSWKHQDEDETTTAYIKKVATWAKESADIQQLPTRLNLDDLKDQLALVLVCLDLTGGWIERSQGETLKPPDFVGTLISIIGKLILCCFDSSAEGPSCLAPPKCIVKLFFESNIPDQHNLRKPNMSSLKVPTSVDRLLRKVLLRRDRLAGSILDHRMDARIETQIQLRDDFAKDYLGRGADLLLHHLTIEQQYFEAFDSCTKVLAIIQSSGSGKSRTMVQLGTLIPGLVVCVRPPDPWLRSSFPPRDDDVADCFLPGKANGELFELYAHLAAWLRSWAICMTELIESIKDEQWYDFPSASSSSTFVQETKGSSFTTSSASKLRKCNDGSSNPCFDDAEGEILDSWKKIVTKLHLLLSPVSRERSFLGSVEEGEDLDEISLTYRQDFLSKVHDMTEEYVKDQVTDCKKKFHSIPPAKTHFAEFWAKEIQPEIKKLEQIAPETKDEILFYLGIDEAGQLGENLSHLRRLWSFVKPKKTWILITDTQSNISRMHGEEATKPSGLLVQNTKKLVTPFCALPFDLKYTKWLEDYMKEPETLTMGDLEKNLAGMGRPLWADTYLTIDMGGSVQIGDVLLGNVEAKLFGDGFMWDSQTSTNCDAMMAAVGHRLPLHFLGMQGLIDARAFQEKQVSHYLRCLAEINVTTESLKTYSASEPLVSLVATRQFRINPARRWSDAIRCMRQLHWQSGLMVGEEGEEGVRLLFTVALDMAATKEAVAGATEAYQGDLDEVDQSSWEVFPSLRKANDEKRLGPVSVAAWLEVLVGSERLDERIKRWANLRWMNFTHFTRLETQFNESKSMPIELIVESWMRQFALMGICNQKHWDLLIPVYKSVTKPATEDVFEPSNMGLMAVQIKNRANFNPSDSECSETRPPLVNIGAMSELLPQSESLVIYVNLRGKELVKAVGASETKSDNAPPPLLMSGCSGKTFRLIRFLNPQAAAYLPYMLGDQSDASHHRMEELDPSIFSSRKGCFPFLLQRPKRPPPSSFS